LNSEEIFRSVLDAMQPAEELGGPTEDEYLRLMERIAHEANARAETYRGVLAETPITV
jgi:hypothetical protein